MGIRLKLTGTGYWLLSESPSPPPKMWKRILYIVGKHFYEPGGFTCVIFIFQRCISKMIANFSALFLKLVHEFLTSYHSSFIMKVVKQKLNIWCYITVFLCLSHELNKVSQRCLRSFISHMNTMKHYRQAPRSLITTNSSCLSSTSGLLIHR